MRKVIGLVVSVSLVFFIFSVLMPPVPAVRLGPGNVSAGSVKLGNPITFNNVNLTIENGEAIPVNFLNFTIKKSSDDSYVTHVQFHINGSKFEDPDGKFAMGSTTYVPSIPYNGSFGYGYDWNKGQGSDFVYGYGYGPSDGVLTILYSITYDTHVKGTFYAMLHVYADDGITSYIYSSDPDDHTATTFTVTSTSPPGGGGPPGNNAPTADAGGPYTGTTGQSITFDGSGSSDSDGSIAGYRWDFDNDGTYDTDWLTTPTTTHSYPSAGTYTLKLEVKDDGGATGTDTTTATISGEEKSSPVANANGPYNGLTFQSITFDGSNSYDPDGTIASHSWDFGDGETASGVKPTHNFTTAGVFTITHTVTDNDGLTDNATTTATILLDSDKDGIDDETEKELGSDPKDASDVKLTGIENGYIVDTDGDGTYDTFYNSASEFGTTIGLDDGKYKIDANGDGEWDYTYDPQSGETVPYEPEEPSDEFPWPIVILSIVIVVAVIIFALFKTGYLYIDMEEGKEK